jgi:hypothetical protein
MSTPAARPVDPDSPLQRGPGRAAGHRGPHFAERPRQEPEQKRRALRRACGRVSYPRGMEGNGHAA